MRVEGGNGENSIQIVLYTERFNLLGLANKILSISGENYALV